MLDEDYGDITDLAEGRDVKVVCTKMPGRMWATTDVRPRGKQTSLSNDAEQVKRWTSSVPDLDEIYECKTYEELEKIVNDWLNGDDSDDIGTPRGAPDPVSVSADDSSAPSSSATYKSLDDAFADLEDI